MPTLVEHLPPTFGTYWEPFLGSGALYFCLSPIRAVLNDSCEPLIQTFIAVRDGPLSVARRATEWPVSRDDYYKVRRMCSSNRFESAAKFIYLNKTCWNGLYRVNSQGHFNVPYGMPKSANVVDEANLVECGRLMRSSELAILNGDFEDAVEGVSSGDLVYFDPPYVTRHNNNGFVDYNEMLFNWKDQERLASLAERLRRLGAHVIVSNAFHSDVIDLYPNFKAIAVSRQSTLAADTSRRDRTTEALFVGG